MQKAPLCLVWHAVPAPEASAVVTFITLGLGLGLGSGLELEASAVVTWPGWG